MGIVSCNEKRVTSKPLHPLSTAPPFDKSRTVPRPTRPRLPAGDRDVHVLHVALGLLLPRLPTDSTGSLQAKEKTATA